MICRACATKSSQPARGTKYSCRMSVDWSECRRNRLDPFAEQLIAGEMARHDLRCQPGFGPPAKPLAEIAAGRSAKNQPLEPPGRPVRQRRKRSVGGRIGIEHGQDHVGQEAIAVDVQPAVGHFDAGPGLSAPIEFFHAPLDRHDRLLVAVALVGDTCRSTSRMMPNEPVAPQHGREQFGVFIAAAADDLTVGLQQPKALDRRGERRRTELPAVAVGLSDPPTENELFDCITATERPWASRNGTTWAQVAPA